MTIDELGVALTGDRGLFRTYLEPRQAGLSLFGLHSQVAVDRFHGLAIRGRRARASFSRQSTGWAWPGPHRV